MDAPFADQHADDPSSWSLYSYVRSNPVSLTDPNGMVCVSPSGGGANYDDNRYPGPTCADIDSSEKTNQSQRTVYGDAVSPTWWQRLGLDPSYTIARRQQQKIENGENPDEMDMLVAEIPFHPGRIASLKAKGLPILDASLRARIFGVIKSVQNGSVNIGKQKTFQNLLGSLPVKPMGYYKELTVTPPASSAGGRAAERLVVGVENGVVKEAYFTNNHYAPGSFVRIF